MLYINGLDCLAECGNEARWFEVRAVTPTAISTEPIRPCAPPLQPARVLARIRRPLTLELMKLVEHREEDCHTLETFLTDRLYEFNSQAIQRFDGKLFGYSLQDDSGRIIAGANGHTWAGICQITNLWVAESRRGEGFGRELMRAVEAEATRLGCLLVLLSSHSFQSPEFYEHLGYERQATIRDHPVGHANFIYAKRLFQHGT